MNNQFEQRMAQMKQKMQSVNPMTMMHLLGGDPTLREAMQMLQGKNEQEQLQVLFSEAHKRGIGVDLVKNILVKCGVKL